MVSTPAGDKALPPDRPLSVYAPIREKAAADYVEAIRKGMDPSRVTDKILEIIRAEHPQPRYAIGLDSWGVSILKSLLPARVLEAGVRRLTTE